MNKPFGAWIFVSHSTKDIEAVRDVRNTLEMRGHNPILFFLRCIEEEAELELLLHREIAARDIFLLCDSSSARDAKWVRREQEFIKSLEGKVIKVLPLDASREERAQILNSLCHHASFYLSYSGKNRRFACQLKEYITAHDYAVSEWADVPLCDDVLHAMHTSIRLAFESGGVILLLGPRSGQYAWSEISDILSCYEEASSPDKRLFAFVTHECSKFRADMPKALRERLMRFQLEDISHLPSKAQMELILSRIRTHES